MYLNLYIISRWLKGITEKKLSSDPMCADITGVSPYYSGMPLNAGIVYVGTAESFGNIPPTGCRFSLVVVGQIHENWMQQNQHDILICNSHFSVSNIVEQIQHIVQKYMKWEHDLLSALIAKKSLSELCEISLPIFGNPILVHGVNFEVLGIAENDQYRYNFDYREAETDFVRQDMIEMLLTDGQFPKTFNKKKPQFFHDRWQMYDLYLNIFIDETYVARIVIDAVCNSLSECDYVPMIVLGQYVQRHLEMYSSSMYKYLHSFKRQLLRFIQEPESVDKTFLSITLEHIKWDKDSRWICVYIRPDTYAFGSKSINYQSELIENTFQNCITVSSDTYIIAIFNCGFRNSEPEALLQNITVFLRDHLIRAGISTNFSDLMKIPVFFHQAKVALEYGEIKNNTTWIHDFFELRLDYILHNGVYMLPLEALVPEELLLLLEYDRVHHAKLYETLCVYLEENCNIQNTIKRLFIHRSTFTYRLSRIYSFVPENLLDTPDKRLYYRNIFHRINQEYYKELSE